MRNDEILNRVLLIVIGALIAILFIGTILGIANKKNQTPEVLVSKGMAVNLAAPANTDIVEYYQLGAIRIISASDSKNSDALGAPMVVNPWLAYPKGDTVFYEEIARKQGTLKAICNQYFSEKTQDFILGLGEEKITSDLLNLINAQLSLGKIQDIYFTDFIFL